MKRVIFLFGFFLLSFLFAACKKSGEREDIIIEIGDSTNFTENEISEAIDIVIDNFSFPAATLTRVWYDEEKSITLTESYLQHGLGSVNGTGRENVIVLLSDFDIDSSGDNPVLNPNTTYTGYQWILIRESKTSEWIIDDWGY